MLRDNRYSTLSKCLGFLEWRTIQTRMARRSCHLLNPHLLLQSFLWYSWTILSKCLGFRETRTIQIRSARKPCRSSRSRSPRRRSRPCSCATVSRLLGWAPSKRFATHTRSMRGRKQGTLPRSQRSRRRRPSRGCIWQWVVDWIPIRYYFPNSFHSGTKREYPGKASRATCWFSGSTAP